MKNAYLVNVIAASLISLSTQAVAAGAAISNEAVSNSAVPNKAVANGATSNMDGDKMLARMKTASMPAMAEMQMQGGDAPADSRDPHAYSGGYSLSNGP